MKKNLVALNANDPQLPQVELYIRTLKEKGKFDGDIVVITTKMSDKVKNYLHGIGAKVFEKELTIKDNECFFWKDIAAYEMTKKSYVARVINKFSGKPNLGHKMLANLYKITKSEADLDASFDLYSRKHFSKLLILDYLKENNDYDKILFTDGDMIFQNPVDVIFDTIEDGQCYVQDELEPIVPNLGIYKSNKCAEHLDIHEQIRYGLDAHELNVGIFAAKLDVFLWIMDEWKKLMFHSNIEELFTCHSWDFWHEQDYFRLLRDMNRDSFTTVAENVFFHAVNANFYRLTRKGDKLVTKESGIEPCIVHFAGGSWKHLDDINSKYTRSIDTIIN